MNFTPEQITVIGTAAVVMAPKILEALMSALKFVLGIFTDKVKEKVKELDEHTERLIKLEGRVERLEKDVLPISKMEKDIGVAHALIRSMKTQPKENS